MPIKTILRQFLRGRALFALSLYILPLIALVVFGFIWLTQNGWALYFFGATLVIVAVARFLPDLVAWLTRRKTAPVAQIDAEGHIAPPVKPLVDSNPEWTAFELAAFNDLAALIAERTTPPMDWDKMQGFAFEIAQRAATTLSQGRKQALDFSIPEALLMVDRVITRLRHDLRTQVPFSDTITLRTLWWLWTNRQQILAGGGYLHTAWRVQRALINPPAAALQEAQNLLLNRATSDLRDTGETTVQRVILEEVARAAIDLYSGHLRYTDAELLEVDLASRQLDLAAAHEDDLPLRLVVAGQISAGKTSLVNALLHEERGETDMAATTPGLVTHETEIDGLAFTLADTAGIDGSAAAEDQILREMLDADMILWVIRANRPARAPDIALLAKFFARFAEDRRRRLPPVIFTLAATDRLLPGWPYPEHLLPAEATRILAELLAAIRADLAQAGVSHPEVLPVSVVAPEWNIAELRSLISHASREALMVQRNRRRLTAAREDHSVTAELKRAGRGLWSVGQALGRGFTASRTPKDKD